MEHHGPDAKAVVWEHNTHIGDARATDMADTGMVNVGQLVRERHMGKGVVLVGFGSHSGTVIAADAWGDVPRIMDVPPAHPGSLEDLLHQALPGSGPCSSSRTCSSSIRPPRATARGSTRSTATARSAWSTGRTANGWPTTSPPSSPSATTPSATSTTATRSLRSIPWPRPTGRSRPGRWGV